MKFLVDRCAGSKLAHWLKSQGYDTLESRERGPDPGDRKLLEWAILENRILITIDTDFGQLIFTEKIPHCGLIRLPDVPASKRIVLMEQILKAHNHELEAGAIITVRGERVRISKPLP